jgi:hypothetical protein
VGRDSRDSRDDVGRPRERIHLGERRVPRQLHFDCFSGISGDMTLGALVDAGVPAEALIEATASVGLPGRLRFDRVKKKGIAAVHAVVEAEPEHKHRHLRHVLEIIERGALTPGAKELAGRMFRRLAEAEAAVHGTTVEKVHFHEVGAVDSIFDFVGIAVALDWLKPDLITASPVPTGSGFVDCDHGRMPVPAPATARLLIGVPLAACAVEKELTTPTGAAVIATFVTEFTRTPDMTVTAIGHGAGTRDLPDQANVLRVFVGESAPASRDSTGSADGLERDSVWQLETNIDDAPAEQLAWTMSRLLEAGALDVFATPLVMKKGRPGTLVAVLVEDRHRAIAEEILFRETGTFGVRRHRVERVKLRRRFETVTTALGPVTVKIGEGPFGTVLSPEFESLAELARTSGKSLRELDAAARQAAVGVTGLSPKEPA